MTVVPFTRVETPVTTDRRILCGIRQRVVESIILTRSLTLEDMPASAVDEASFLVDDIAADLDGARRKLARLAQLHAEKSA